MSLDGSSADPSPPTLASLPVDCVVSMSVAGKLSMLDICRLATSSRALSKTLKCDGIWRALLLEVCQDVGQSSSTDARASFCVSWTEAMRVIDQIAQGLDSVARSQASPVVSSSLFASADTPMSMSTSRVPGALSDGASDADLSAATLQLKRRACPRISVDWLYTRAASSSPLGCLVVLCALKFDASSMDAPDCCTAYAAVGPWLLDGLSRTPPVALNAQITLRWTTWSQLRDCRGFRARDDIHRCSARLVDLCRDQADGSDVQRLWAVLSRGVGHEVSSIRLLPS